MSHYKIIFAGPVGAGKSTAVSAASDIPPIRTDALASDEVRDLKPNTTVALDYGAMKLADGSATTLVAVVSKCFKSSTRRGNASAPDRSAAIDAKDLRVVA